MSGWIVLPQGGWREEWVNTAFAEAAAEARGIPGAAPMYVPVSAEASPATPRLAGSWDIHIVGLAFRAPADPQEWPPVWRQAVEEQKTCAFREEGPSGRWRLCVATPHPSGLQLVRVRDLLALKVGAPVGVRIYQRGDSEQPAMVPLGLERLPQRERVGVLREISHVLEPPAKTGPVPRPAGEPPPPNWSFLRLLGETVVNLIDTSCGETPTPARLREAMGRMKADTFRRRLESLRVDDDQLEACALRLVMDYDRWCARTREAERHDDVGLLPEPVWRPERSLRELLADESPEFARLLRGGGG